MTKSDLLERVEAMRRFNRFYTKQIGVLHEGLLKSPFSLTEARVLYELAHHDEPTATDLGQELGLDAGYLSRMLRGIEKRGLLQRKPSKNDGRRNLLRLTERGKGAFAKLNASSRNEIQVMLSGLTVKDQKRAIAAMHTIEALFGSRPETKVPYILRPHQPGDMGWVVHRHGVLYSQEYGWDERFEALVAGIVARFIERYDEKRERCWIAEREGEIVGSVFLVKKSATVAKLRLLLVEPHARGLGIGSRLVDECTRFARRVGYRKITLWTNDVLHAARKIYEKSGFHLTHREQHRSFGHDLVGETWDLEL